MASQAVLEKEILDLQIPKVGLSFEEFLAWCDEDTFAEFVDGEIILFSPASKQHQRIGSFLESLLRFYTEVKNIGEIFRAPFLMRLPNLSSGREPDLMFVSKERIDLVEDTYLNGPADLVVEIISPESENRDRYEKFAEYEKAGVKEYWLIEPNCEEALFYQLRDGCYKNVKVDAAGIYHSDVIQGFRLKKSWLWEIPPLLEVLQELNLLS